VPKEAASVRGAHSCFFGGMWWDENGVIGVAVPTRKFVGMS